MKKKKSHSSAPKAEKLESCFCFILIRIAEMNGTFTIIGLLIWVCQQHLYNCKHKAPVCQIHSFFQHKSFKTTQALRAKKTPPFSRSLSCSRSDCTPPEHLKYFVSVRLTLSDCTLLQKATSFSIFNIQILFLQYYLILLVPQLWRSIQLPGLGTHQYWSLLTTRYSRTLSHSYSKLIEAG